jgi:hypothetical protein
VVKILTVFKNGCPAEKRQFHICQTKSKTASFTLLAKAIPFDQQKNRNK